MLTKARKMDGTKKSPDFLSEVFSAIANETRRKIIERLAEGEATVSELAELFGISMPAISRHLNTLEETGLIVRSKDGRHNRCQLNAEPLKEIVMWMKRFESLWEMQIDNLSHYLDKLKGKR